MWERLSFTPSGVSNRITEYSLVALILPMSVAGAMLAWRGLRWLLTAVWPGPVEIVAERTGLTFCLGPMGTSRHDAAHLEAKYPFELLLDGDELDDSVYEAHLPPEQQQAEFLPRIRDLHTKRRLDRNLVAYTAQSPERLSTQLRPLLDAWRQLRSTDAGA